MNSLPLAICTLVFCIPVFGKSTQNTGSEVESGIHGDTPLLLYFRSDDCTDCASVDQYFMNDAIKMQLEEHYVAVCLDVEETEGKACAEIYQVRSVPTVIIADRQGKVLFRTRPLHAEREICRILEDLGIDGHVSENPSPLKPDLSEPVEQQPRPLSRLAVLHQNTSTALCHSPGPIRQPQAEPIFHSAATEKAGFVQPPEKETLPAGQPNVVSAQPDRQPQIRETVLIDESTGTEVAEPKPGSKWRYAVQLGYFSSEPYAQKLVAKAGEKGVSDVRTVHGERDGNIFYRVLSGTYSSLHEAQKHLDYITSLGLKAAIHRW